MTLIIHIIIALTSIFYTGFTFINPSKTKLNISYGLVVATLISGTHLVLVNLSHMVSACLTGIVYLAFVTVGLVAAHRRLVSQKV